MNPETQTIRLPRPEFRGQNGFLQQLTDPEQITDQNLSDALQRQQRFEFFLEHQKRDIPDFEDMEAEVEQKEDKESFERRIKSLQASHHKDLERLYDWNAAEYAESIYEQGVNRDHTSQRTETSEEERMLTEDVYEIERQRLQINWHDRFESLRHAYLSQLIPLSAAKINAAAEEEKQRRIQERMFPLTREDFNSKPPDAKLRVARFLVADTQAMKERFMNEHDWAWRQVQPLIDIFKKDLVFASNVRGMVISSQNATVTDPRKRPTA